MAARRKKTDESSPIEIRATVGMVQICLRGTTPLLMNRVSEKAKRQLLLPDPPKSRADKLSTLKQDPFREFQDAPYRSMDSESPTLLQMPSTAFKSAMRGVAVDVSAKTSKAQLGRLTYVEGTYVPIWGLPTLKMDIVRQNDVPCVRTRACIEHWAAMLSIRFTEPILSRDTIITLMANAGIMQGVGDYRAEKGVGNFGSWELCDPDDKAFTTIVKMGGREAQQEAMDNPECFDQETSDLLEWFSQTAQSRGFKPLGRVG